MGYELQILMRGLEVCRQWFPIGTSFDFVQQRQRVGIASGTGDDVGDLFVA